MACEKDSHPRLMSFNSARMWFQKLTTLFKKNINNETLNILTKEKVGQRKYRWEPRKLKKRCRGTYGLLMVARSTLKVRRDQYAMS